MRGQPISCVPVGFGLSKKTKPLPRKPGDEKCRQWFAVCLIIVLGFYLRIVYLTYGLPYVPNGDEAINFNVLNGMVQNGDFNPGFFRYPSLLFNLNLPGQYALDHLVGPISNVDVQAIGTGFLDHEAALILARATGVFLGVGTVCLVIWAVCRVTGSPWGGVLGGLLLAISPLSIRYASYFTPDVTATFFVTSSVVASMMIVRNPSLFWYVLAGGFGGLAASTKYNAGAVVIAIVIASFVVSGKSRRNLSGICVSASIATIVFLGVSPFLILDFSSAWSGFIFELNHYRTGHPGAEGDSFIQNLSWMHQQTGWTFLVIIPALFSGTHQKVVLPVFGFLLCYFALLSNQNVRFERNILPLLPSYFLLVAIGGSCAVHKISKLFGRESYLRVYVPLVGLAVLFLFRSPLSMTLDQFRFYDRDPNQAARLWLEEYLPDSGQIVIEAYTPYLALLNRDLVSHPFLLEQDVETTSSSDFAVITHRGSGRFLSGNYEVQHQRFIDLKAMACDFGTFPPEAETASITVLHFEC